MKFGALLVLLSVGCAGIIQPPKPKDEPYTGGLQDMSWYVECEPDMLHEIAERWEYESPNYCDAENLNAGEINGYGMCAEWMVIRYRYEAAKREYRRKCEATS